jgi:uncharacterized glyoxalase superfamily protein PhnB
MRNKPTGTPGLLYHNAPAMIEWLCNAFCFEKRMVVPENDKILHAHLTFDNGGIMLSSAEEYAYPELCKSTKDAGGVGTVEIIVFVSEIPDHYKKAKQWGTQIIVDLEDKPYGGKGYSGRDPEGHVWAFGSDDAWED